jgi:alkylation response protein AidB-like acyl-CoA dehydrogenase
MGARPRGVGPVLAPPEPEDAQARDVVWQVLAELGALRLAGAQDGLVVAAEMMGGALYASPYLDTITAAELLGNVPELTAGIADGVVTVAIAPRADGLADPAVPGPMSRSGDCVTATRRFVAFAPDVDYLLVVGTVDGMPRMALVRRDQPAITIRRHDDLGRGDLYQVTAVAAGVARWLDGAAWPAGLARARLRLAAYLVGQCRAALSLTVDYTKRRQQFGQPIARHQAVAFRLAAYHARIEATRDLVHYGAWEADTGADVTYTAAQALALAGELAREVTADAIQLHGAYGMTERCDAQLYYRRAAQDSVCLGTPTQLRLAVASHLGGEY